MILFILISLVIITILSYSGFGNQIHINDGLLIISWIGIFYYITNKNLRKPLILGQWSILINPICIILLFNVISNYYNPIQLLNYTTLFGIIIGTTILSHVRWLKGSPFKTGIILWFISWSMTILFIPGSILSGWNKNSSIGLMPAIMCGLGYIYISHKPFKNIYFYACLSLSLLILLRLENRSSIISLLLFGLIATPYLIKNFSNITLFRLFYIGTLFINIGFPLFNEFINHWDLYNNAVSISLEYTNKGEGLSGREDLWNFALSLLEHKPLLGYGGMRGIYFHNFSCDILTQFGWIGWFTFAFMYIRLMEKCFIPGCKSNIFLLAIGSLLILNTFENALLANCTFSIYSYVLFAIPLYLKYHHRI